MRRTQPSEQSLFSVRSKKHSALALTSKTSKENAKATSQPMIFLNHSMQLSVNDVLFRKDNKAYYFRS